MEQITLEEIIEMIDGIKKDAERLTTGNVAHQRVHIIGACQFLIDDIKKLIEHTKTN